MYSRRYRGKINMVILDLAGTTCDESQDLRHRWPEDDLLGSKAPVLPFYTVFKKNGITLDWASIRQPMGMYQPDHLRVLLDLPVVRDQYKRVFGHPYTEEEYLVWLDDLKTLMAHFALDDDLVRPVEGASECVAELRQAEILIGCNTGYFDGISRALMYTLEDKYDLGFDVSSNADNVNGCPSPCMIYDCMMKAHVWPSDSVIKVDDTVTGILSGNNANCWTVGVYASGCHDYEKLLTAQPDFLIPSIKYLPEVIFGTIEPCLRRGSRPGYASR